MRRRRAARDHRLPELREPGEAGDRLGARRGDRGHGRRLRGARDPGRLRKRLALQRDRRPRDPPHSGGRLRRPRPRRPRDSGHLARRRCDLPRRRAPALARRLGVPVALRRARRAGRRRSTSRRKPSSSAPSTRPPRAARSSTTRPKAVSRSRWRRLRSQAASAPSSIFPTTRWRSSAKAAARRSSRRARDLDWPRIGTVGGATLLGVPVEQLRQAWEVTPD